MPYPLPISRTVHFPLSNPWKVRDFDQLFVWTSLMIEIAGNSPFGDINVRRWEVVSVEE